jgi:hypothetical protein
MVVYSPIYLINFAQSLKARDDHVSSVLEEAKIRLATITKDRQK